MSEPDKNTDPFGYLYWKKTGKLPSYGSLDPTISTTNPDQNSSTNKPTKKAKIPKKERNISTTKKPKVADSTTKPDTLSTTKVVTPDVKLFNLTIPELEAEMALLVHDPEILQLILRIAPWPKKAELLRGAQPKIHYKPAARGLMKLYEHLFKKGKV